MVNMLSSSAKRRRIDVVDHSVRNDFVTDYIDVCYYQWCDYDMDGIEWSELCDCDFPPQCMECIAYESAYCSECDDQTDAFEDECVECVIEASTMCTICGGKGHSKYTCPFAVDHTRGIIAYVPALMRSTLDYLRNFRFNWSGRFNFF